MVTAPVSVALFTLERHCAVDRLLSSKLYSNTLDPPSWSIPGSVSSPSLPCNAKIEKSKDTMEGGSFLSGRQTSYIIIFLIQMVLLKINVDIVLVCLVY